MSVPAKTLRKAPQHVNNESAYYSVRLGTSQRSVKSFGQVTQT